MSEAIITMNPRTGAITCVFCSKQHPVTNAVGGYTGPVKCCGVLYHVIDPEPGERLPITERRDAAALTAALTPRDDAGEW